MTDSFDRLVAALGHDFANRELLREALTHPSVERTARPSGSDYDRLEFLGDRVLGLVIADLLFHRYPEAPAGDLARRYNALVRQETLAKVAETLNIGQALRLSRSERATGGAAKPAILADACEAVIAALYLDGGLETARRFILQHWRALAEVPAGVAKDPKTLLQEWAQGLGLPTPDYRLVATEGPPHAPVFTIAATVGEFSAAMGRGRSKREAEQAAATALMLAQGVGQPPAHVAPPDAGHHHDGGKKGDRS